MKYDFTTILDRKGKDAIAVDLVGAPGSNYPAPREGFDVIPMWVADMNFPVVPTIQEAMIARAQQPTFGYFFPRQEYTQAIIDWQRSHNGADVAPENIGYEINITRTLIQHRTVGAAQLMRGYSFERSSDFCILFHVMDFILDQLFQFFNQFHSYASLM